MERLHEDANKPLATTTWHGARGTFQPCSLLKVVSNMSLVTVFVMVYLRLDSGGIPAIGPAAIGFQSARTH